MKCLGFSIPMYNLGKCLAHMKVEKKNSVTIMTATTKVFAESTLLNSECSKEYTDKK